MAYIVHVVTGDVGMPVHVLFVSSRSISFSTPSAGAITDHRQSAKDINPYFKSQLYVEDSGHRKPVLILPNGISTPEERAHDRNFILPWAEFEPTTS